ncbi:aldo/keto reductase [Liquorilactobacillus nagelii]|uniref:aldo/keto reductase n=1 Tax=Liquorilactobacillus nagelii TaxID=82688 RepID=UPI0039EA4962
MYLAATDRYEQLPIRQVGKTGLRLPAVSLGLWHNFDSASPYYQRKQLLLAALDRGVFSFDCADRYGSPEVGSAEKLLGEVLQHEFKPYRDELVITTKTGFRTYPGPYGYSLSRKSILQAIDHSLERLKTDYVDIYYAHRFDPTVDLFETAQALDQVVRSGKALYIGVSNFDAQQTAKIAAMFRDLKTPFVVNQVSYNMLNQSVEQDDLLDKMQQLGAGLVAYGPLAEGLLSDRYLSGIPADFAIHRTSNHVFDQGKAAVTTKLQALNKLAQKREQSLSQMALAWLLRNQVVSSVIIGTTSIEHLDENLQALEHADFTATELEQIQKILN